MPGASDIKSVYKDVGATSATRVTLATPTSGKKARIIAYGTVAWNTLTTDPGAVEFYFGTGATINQTNKIIGAISTGTRGGDSKVFPDGAGPVGAADDVISWRTELETETSLFGWVLYREE